MNVLDMKTLRNGVVLRLGVVALLAATLGTGCRSGRRPVVAGPGDAQPTEPGGWKSPSSEGGPDVQSVPGAGGMGTDLPLGSEEGPLAPVFFEYDSATLTAEAQATLQRHSLWIKDHPGTRFNLEGHCDERGTAEYNLALGEQRARAVYDYLTSLGVPGNRLSTVSFGKERPLDPGHGEQAWARNRRVHFAVSG